MPSLLLQCYPLNVSPIWFLGVGETLLKGGGRRDGISASTIAFGIDLPLGLDLQEWEGSVELFCWKEWGRHGCKIGAYSELERNVVELIELL